MITINNVSKSYKKEVKSVEGLSLEIKKGEIFGFLGPNGAGKTTTLRMITGILKADEGSILIDNFDIEKNPYEAKKQFGYVSDDPNLFVNLKAIDYFKFIADIYGVVDFKNKLETLAKDFEIYDVLNNKIESFSHGMRQKVFIIGVLLHQPNNWILDEPLTGLDPKSAFTLKAKMKEHANQNKTVLFSTHVLDVAEKLCDRVGIINKGKLIFVGTIEEMKQHFANDGNLESLFLEITENE